MTALAGMGGVTLVGFASEVWDLGQGDCEGATASG